MPETTPTGTKGQKTREEILRLALELACTTGLEGMSIGALATVAGMSKSGLYAHFSSKEDLQCAVIDAAKERFINAVLIPAFQAPRGIPRIEQLCRLWTMWEDEKSKAGCSLMAAATDFDDRPGPVHDKVAAMIDEIINTFSRAAEIAVEEGQFSADLDTRRFGYEAWGILLARQQLRRLLNAQDADSLAVASYTALIDRSRTTE
ncbi:MAG: TetR/AcrR family transcriptional regulator [Demequinaceae bacterium]|nr:TetR/AcrR family transcriptional regulator [Demequinaceae bacterium]